MNIILRKALITCAIACSLFFTNSFGMMKDQQLYDLIIYSQISVQLADEYNKFCQEKINTAGVDTLKLQDALTKINNQANQCLKDFAQLIPKAPFDQILKEKFAQEIDAIRNKYAKKTRQDLDLSGMSDFGLDFSTINDDDEINEDDEINDEDL